MRTPSPLFLLALCLLTGFFLLGIAACDSSSDPDEDPTENPDGTFQPKILGVCFMGDEPCVSTYEDLGPYDDTQGKTQDGIPVYIFPAVPENDGGLPNPLDSLGLYNAFRLQNNVFARPGKVWAVWKVYSDSLNLMAEPFPGRKIWGVDADQSAGGDIKDTNARDLYASPILSEAEIFEMEAAGLIRLENTFKLTDCPVTPARPGDHVVNLNPGFRICDPD